MKAIKINKIQWNLEGLNDEERNKAIESLPLHLAFITKDDYNVVDNLPTTLKKKYGFETNTFSFIECRIVENVEDLLKICAPKGKKPKEIFTPAGNLTSYGKECKTNLESNIKMRIQLERNHTSAYDMPKILDEVMLGVEKISNLTWDGHTCDELLAPIYKKIWEMRTSNLKDEEELRNAAESCMENED